MSEYNEQSGGFWNVEIFPVDKVTGWQPVLNDDNGGLLVFPEDVVTLQVEDNGINLREDPSVTANGERYSTNVTLNTIGLGAAIQKKVDEVNFDLVVIRTTDLDGVRKLYGNSETPLRMVLSPDEGNNQEQGKGYQISCTGTTMQRSIYL